MGEPERNADSGDASESLRTLVAAQANPLRSRLLIILRMAGPLGAAELALRTGEPAQKVRRHLNALCEQGLASVSEEVRRRGTLKRVYVADRDFLIDEDGDERLSEGERRRSSLGLLRLIFEEARRAAANPRLGMRSDRVVANLPARVDARGWRELSELHTETLERAMRIVEQSKGRLKESGGPSIGVISEQILLEAPDYADPPERS